MLILSRLYCTDCKVTYTYSTFTFRVVFIHLRVLYRSNDKLWRVGEEEIMNGAAACLRM